MATDPFPLRTFVNFSNFRYYYAFGNSSPEDLASCVNGVENPSPEILSLGCGDMRNCFYTILKHFGPSSEKSASSFRGMNFILNDHSAGILARNVLQILLAVETPKNPLKAKEHFTKAWGIFYNHGLTEEEQNLLQKSLNQLVCWTESEEKWKETEENPLRNVVSFHSADTMKQIRELWILWIAGYPHSMDEMFRQRKKYLLEGLRVKDLNSDLRAENKETAIAVSSLFIGELSVHEVSDTEVSAAREEILNYSVEGSVSSDDYLPRKHVNPTLFDRTDWKYVLDFLSPFFCFHHCFFFKESVLKKNCLDSEFLSLLPVPDDQFRVRPLFSNSFQQFALWLISVRNALNCPDVGVRFKFHCGDCLDLMVSHSIELKSGNGKAVGFEVIHSSNLIDHVGLPNLVLAARDVLKPNGFLFTALMHLHPDVSLSQYVTSYFGVPFERLPILFNMRCVGHDGPFGDGILPYPNSVFQEMSSGQHQHVSLIWQRVDGMPISMKSLDSFQAKSLVEETVASLTIPQMIVDRHHLTNAMAVCKSLLILVSQINEEECSWKNPEFWEEYCDLLKKEQSISSNFWELQTMFLLHGLHIHLKVGNKDCPICQNVPVSEFIALYEVPTVVDIGSIFDVMLGRHFVRTPYYEVFIHDKELPFSRGLVLDEQNLPSGTMKVRCVAGSNGESGPVTLRFYFPRKFGDPGNFRFTAFPCLAVTIGALNALMRENKSGFRLQKVPCAGDLLLHAMKQSDHGFLFEQAGTQISVVSGGQWTLNKNVWKVDGDDPSHYIAESLIKVEVDVAASDLTPKRISERKIEIRVKKLKHPISLVYPFAVNFGSLKIHVKRKERTVAVRAERAKHIFSEQDPSLFYSSPNNFLANPPSSLSESALGHMGASQFSVGERELFDNLKMTALMNLKTTLIVLLQQTNKPIYQFSFKQGESVQAVLVVHQRLIDVEHTCQLLDVSYWRFKPNQMNLIMREWEPFVQKQGRLLLVDEAELDLLDRLVRFFKPKTVLAKGDESNIWKDSAAPIRKMKVKAFFERAVIHPLSTDDMMQYRNFVGLIWDCSSENMNIDSTPSVTCSYCHSASAHPLMCNECGETTNAWTCGKEKCSDVILKDSEHKKQCKGRTLKPACKKCGNQSETLKKCSGCGLVEYCNGKCQGSDWPSHKKECKAGMDYKLKSRCGHCQRESVDLKLCTGCGVVRYCNVHCQKSHWVKHKPNCKK